LRVQRITSGEFISNSYIIYDHQRCFIIDTNTSAQAILNKIKQCHIPNPEFVVVTHGHFDHFGGAKTLSEKFDIPIYMNLTDIRITKSANFSMMLMKLTERVEPPEFYSIDKAKDKLRELGYEYIHAPGHTPGSTVIVGGQTAFVGDLFTKRGLFLNNLPGENKDDLQSSFVKIKEMLEPTTMIYPGHGTEFIFKALNTKPFKGDTHGN